MLEKEPSKRVDMRGLMADDFVTNGGRSPLEQPASVKRRPSVADTLTREEIEGAVRLTYEVEDGAASAASDGKGGSAARTSLPVISKEMLSGVGDC